jgi:hypothetical protein
LVIVNDPGLVDDAVHPLPLPLLVVPVNCSNVPA